MTVEEMLEAALEASIGNVPEEIEEAPVENTLIPENSDVYLIKESTSRFSDAIWFEEIAKQRIILGGAGGISSWVALLLSRLRIDELVIYDPDVVEAVNMAGQFYSTDQIGESKVVSVHNNVGKFSNYYNTSCLCRKYDENSFVYPIMICGFDNMEARKIFFKNWLEVYGNRENSLFIDGRLAAESYQVIAIQGNDGRAIKEYKEKWLFTDEEAEETPCSYKQTSFMATMIASTMVNIFVNFVANMCDPIIPRDVPFLTEYTAETMYTKIIM